MTVPSDINQMQAMYTKDGVSTPTSGMVPQAMANSPQSASMRKSNNKRGVFTAIGLVLLLVVALSGVLISRKQQLDKSRVAPTAPESRPSADEPATCTLQFTVGGPEVTPTPTSPAGEKLSCGQSNCLEGSQSPATACAEGLVCVKVGTGDFEIGYCAKPGKTESCAANPGVVGCCSEAEPTPTTPSAEKLSCAESNCLEGTQTANSPCAEGLVCVKKTTGDFEVGYCSKPEKVEACRANPSEASCCQPVGGPSATPTPHVDASPTPTNPPDSTPTPSLTPPPGASPTPTLPPGVTPEPTGYSVDTTVQCNESCAANADCANITHICYNGKCRLDQNPEDQYCRLPSGATTTAVQVIPTAAAQPTLPEELPASGFADLANYLKVGLGALGLGIVLLLLL